MKQVLLAIAAILATAAQAFQELGDQQPDTAEPEVAPPPAKAAAKGKAATAAATKPAGKGKGKPIASTPEVTLEDVKAKMTEVVKTHGRDTAIAILTEFGAAKLTELSEDDYAAALAKAEEVLAAEPEGDEAEDEI